MKRFYVQVIDGARNCAYDVFSVSPEDFHMIFPDDGQDIEFVEDFVARDPEAAARICDRMWQSREDKKSIEGIQGTLFYGLEEKRRFYPTKRESDLDTPPLGRAVERSEPK